MNRKAKIWFHSELAGQLEETENGYKFTYDTDYTYSNEAFPISQTLKLQDQPYQSKVLFPFFDGLIPEGWLLDIAIDNWKVKANDRFGLFLACCKNSIGAVSVVSEENEEL